MRATPMTFADMQRLTEINLIGGYLELTPFTASIYRGKIDDILWWNTHPRWFDLMDGCRWDSQKKLWSKDPGQRVPFPFEDHESFLGPYQTEDDDGVIFFFFHAMAVTIFPRGVEIPHEPVDATVWKTIHNRTMNPETDRTGR